MTRIRLPLPSRIQLEEEYRREEEILERVLFELHRRIKLLLTKSGLQATVKYRIKSFDSYYQKILRRASSPVDEKERYLITDLLGIRVVCPFIADLPIVEKIIAREFSILERERKGAEFSFKEFGYESLHYLIGMPQDLVESFGISAGMVCEVQLRTILQDAWAEVEHELVYKSDYTPFDESLRRKLAALNANLSLADMVFHEIREYQRELQKQLRRRRSDFWELVRKSEDENLVLENEKNLKPLEGEYALEPSCREPSSAPGIGEGESRDGATTEIENHSALPLDEEPGMGVNFSHRDEIDSHLLKALYAHNAHRYQEALSLYTEILKMEPRQAVKLIVLVHRGMVHFVLGHYHKAIEDFGRSLEGEGDHRKAYYYRAVAHRQLGAYAEALDDLNQCLSLDPFQAEALLSRAQTLVKLGDYSAALQDVDSALSLRPHDEEAHRFRVVLTSKLGV